MDDFEHSEGQGHRSDDHGDDDRRNQSDVERNDEGSQDNNYRRGDPRDDDNRERFREGDDNFYDRKYSFDPAMRGTGTSILIKNLNYSTDRDKLAEIFSEYGQICDVYIPLDYFSREPRGFAFCEFLNEEDANTAIDKLDGQVIDDFCVTVTKAERERKRPEDYRRRAGRDRYNDRPSERYGDRRGSRYNERRYDDRDRRGSSRYGDRERPPRRYEDDRRYDDRRYYDDRRDRREYRAREPRDRRSSYDRRYEGSPRDREYRGERPDRGDRGDYRRDGGDRYERPPSFEDRHN